MGVFDDKKFERLDWMTQITETIDSKLNDILAALPDRIEFSTDHVINAVKHQGIFMIRADSAVRSLLEKDGHNLSWDETDKIVSCFALESSQDLELDFENDTMTGTLALVKLVPTLTDEDLQPMMGSRGIEALRGVYFEGEWPLERLNEMLDVLGRRENAQKNRSGRKKLNSISDRLTEIFTTNEWRIRDMELADRVGHWIAEYINKGNLAALTNLCKLKVMTHNNMPIYSVEEEK